MPRKRTKPRPAVVKLPGPAVLEAMDEPPPGWTIEAVEKVVAETFPAASGKERLWAAVALFFAAQGMKNPWLDEQRRAEREGHERIAAAVAAAPGSLIAKFDLDLPDAVRRARARIDPPKRGSGKPRNERAEALARCALNVHRRLAHAARAHEPGFADRSPRRSLSQAEYLTHATCVPERQFAAKLFELRGFKRADHYLRKAREAQRRAK